MWIVPDPEKHLGKDHHPFGQVEHRKLLQGGETLDLLPVLEMDPDLHPLLKGDIQTPIGRQMRTMPVEHSKFIWDIVSYISNLQAFSDFALGCGIPSRIVQKAIEDNDPSDDDISLDDCVAQVLTVWWLISNKPAIWKSDRIRQGFVKLHMPAFHSCLIKRHPTMDPNPSRFNNQTGPQVDRCPKDQLNI